MNRGISLIAIRSLLTSELIFRIGNEDEFREVAVDDEQAGEFFGVLVIFLEQLDGRFTHDVALGKFIQERGVVIPLIFLVLLPKQQGTDGQLPPGNGENRVLRKSELANLIGRFLEQVGDQHEIG